MHIFAHITLRGGNFLPISGCWEENLPNRSKSNFKMISMVNFVQFGGVTSHLGPTTIVWGDFKHIESGVNKPLHGPSTFLAKWIHKAHIEAKEFQFSPKLAKFREIC